MLLEVESYQYSFPVVFLLSYNTDLPRHFWCAHWSNSDLVMMRDNQVRFEACFTVRNLYLGLFNPVIRHNDQGSLQKIAFIRAYSYSRSMTVCGSTAAGRQT